MPAGVQIPVDPEKAQLQREFYHRYDRERAEREQAAARRQQKPVPSAEEEPAQRDWATALAAVGVSRRRW